MLRLLFVATEPPEDLSLLRTEGRKIEAAHVDDLDTAIETMAQQPFDAIMLNVVGKTAEDVRGTIDRLRASHDPAVVVLVSDDQTRRANVYLSAGAQDFLALDRLSSDRVAESARAALERKTAETRIAGLAEHDSLTGLPNETLMRGHLDRVLAAMPEEKHYVAVHLIDLDRFSEINDTLGTEVGDAVLRAVALRLMEGTRASDMLVRLSNDTFALVHDHVDAPEDARALATRLIDRVTGPIEISKHEIYLSARAGVALYPDNAVTTDALLRAAELALHAAKTEPESSCRLYSPQLSATLVSRHRLEHELRRALDQEHFVLHYQPKVEMATGLLAGVEALVRWRSPDKGLILPSSFIPTAESRGLIAAVGRWVLRTACDDLNMFVRRGLPEMPIAINLSPPELCDDSLVADIVDATQKAGLAPSAIEVEVTETAMPRDMTKAFGVMARLRDLGIEIAIDDFGTAYASLMHLRRLPFSKVKIDRAFISGIGIDPDAQEIVRTIISLGHNLDMEVIAEGVESEAQYDFLKTYGCDAAQGYWFSKPLPADKLVRLIGAGFDTPSMAAQRSKAC